MLTTYLCIVNKQMDQPHRSDVIIPYVEHLNVVAPHLTRSSSRRSCTPR